MNFQRIENLDAKGRRVFLRVDLNITADSSPIKENPKILRILPTIELLLRKGACLILASHLEASSEQAKLIYSHLSTLFPNTKLIESSSMSDWLEVSKNMREGEIVYIPNLNSQKEEMDNDAGFAKSLSSLGELFVNEAFSQSNKTLASTVGITRHLPSYPGTLFYREVESLTNILTRPAKPYVAIIGGAKVSSKIKLLNSLLNRANAILVGGGMAYTFLKSRAVPVGSSIVEKEFEVLSHQFIDKAGIAGVEFHMPQDHIIADSFGDKAKTKSVDRMGIIDGWMGMDIGNKTLSNFEKIIKNAGTIFWTGPMGVTELDKFSAGSLSLAKVLAKSNAKTIVSGDHTSQIVYRSGIESKITHISLGGSSTIEFLEGKNLPGIKALIIEKDE